MCTVYEVFQSSGVPRHTRINIEEHNQRIISFFHTPGEHLIIHGPSKSGKSTLWVSQIGKSNVIKIPCNNSTTLEYVYKEIIDELDIYFQENTKIDQKVKAGFKAELKAKIIGVGSGGGGASLSSERGFSEEHQRAIAPQIGSRNISKYLKQAEKYVVLENIHYSSQEFRSDLSKELHNFSDYECKWVVVGVQHQADQVFIENRDLVGRLREVKLGWLNPQQCKEILCLGETKLNIKFSETIKNRIVEESFGNPALVQDIAKNVCTLSGIFGTQEKKYEIIDESIIPSACKAIASGSEQVYRKFCDDIAKGGRSDGSTAKYKWFLRLIRDKEIPVSGILNTAVYKNIIDMGHPDIGQTSVTQGLKYTNKLQDIRNITPPVMEYDGDKKRLFLLDPYFKFSLRWIPDLIEEL